MDANIKAYPYRKIADHTAVVIVHAQTVAICTTSGWFYLLTPCLMAVLVCQTAQGPRVEEIWK